MSSLKESEVRRERAEEKLRHQLDLTRAITNSLGEGVCALDLNGSITFMNPAAERMFGWKETELLGKNIHQSIHYQRADGSPYPVEECPLLSVVRAGMTHTSDEDIFTRKDGSMFPVSFLSSPIVTNGRVSGAVIAFRDITQRKKIEADLLEQAEAAQRERARAQESEQYYRTLTEAIPQQVWTARPDGALDYLNQRVLDYFGRTEEEMLGWAWQEMVHAEDLPQANERWTKSLKTGQTYTIEFRLKRADGVYRWHLGRALPVRGADGQIIRWFGTNTEIEEQKRLEETLAAMNREREQMLEEVSTPLVPVWRGVLVLPLIGSLDTERMQRATDAALHEVTRTGARACIIDITGARIIDSHAVANLSHLVSSLKLIGAEAIVTGVTAHAAQTLVGLGVDFDGMRTHRTLAEALASIIKNSSH